MEWECTDSISLYFLLYCYTLELFPTQSPHFHRGTNRIISFRYFGHIYIAIDLQYMSGHSPPFVFMYSIISTKEFSCLLQSLSWVMIKTLQAISLCISVPFMACQLDSRISKVHFHTNQCSFSLRVNRRRVQLIIHQQGHTASVKIQPITSICRDAAPYFTVSGAAFFLFFIQQLPCVCGLGLCIMYWRS